MQERRPAPILFEVLDAVERRGLPDVEVYCKRGRSRQLRNGREGTHGTFREEVGWAVRAAAADRALFFAATGAPRADAAWPEPRPGVLRLPQGRAGAEWRPPSDLEAPLVGEIEGLALLQAVSRTLEAELRGAVLLRGVLDDGSSEVEIVSSRGVGAVVRNRSAEVRLWAAAPSGVTAEVSSSAREARHLSPTVLARRLADRLTVKERGEAVTSRDRGAILVAPDVAATLVAALVPLLVGTGRAQPGWATLEALADRSGRIGSAALTLIDDGRLAGGLFEAPVDGEGVPTREVVLVEEGILRQPLLPFWEVPGARQRISGCRLRPGWRDLPETGPTHLYVRPVAGRGVAALLSEVARGYYFIDLAGAPRVDLGAGRVALPVLGFEVRGGRPVRPIRRAWLAAGVGPLLRGVQGAARDLTFVPVAGGAVGSPSLLLSGLEVRGDPWRA